MMRLSFAPMEGIGWYEYRVLHNRMCPGADIYYSPFIAPDREGRFKASRLRDVLPENNDGIRLVPQILANSAESFLAAARTLCDLGYSEVDLNAGCPSSTVVTKHKGAGMLSDPDALDAFLADVFSRAPVAVSVKTRLGLYSTGEFERLLRVYEKYPLSALTVHARDRAGMYSSTPDLGAFSLALESRLADRVSYNGDVFTPAAFGAIKERFPSLGGVMIGRGAAGDPALFREIRGGAALGIGELREFHGALMDALRSSGLSPSFAAARMKELWYYTISLFPDSAREYKALMKARSESELRARAEDIFSYCRFEPQRGFSPHK